MENTPTTTVDRQLTVFLPDNTQWRNRFEIKSETSNRIYVIAQNKSSGKWGCSCPGWIIHRKCKHLRSLDEQLKVIEEKTNPKSLKGL